MKRSHQVLFIGCQILLLGSLVQAQYDGSFWWMNTDLLKTAEQIRQEKDVKSTVVNNDTEIDSIRLSGNTYTDGDGDSPDCICVPSNLCRTTLTGEQARDSLCGSGQTCCRKHHIITQHHPHAATTTAPRPIKPVTPIALHAPVLPIDLPVLSDSPNQSLLLEISALLQEFNTHEHPLEPDAEFVFDITTSIPSPTSTPPSTTPFKPIVFSDARPTPATTKTTSSTTRTTTSTSTTTTTPRTTPKATLRPNLPPKPKKCGQRRLAIASRIHFQDSEEVIEEPLDGTVNLGEFPWTVYLEERIGNGSFLYKCGGALITSGAVVTAGHCIANARDYPERFQIVAGDGIVAII